ncbi:hypothetical protein L1987_26811 [Smallanthus sonchifolius]|uniref:Uncharacterized protein n=1 Tax=Smallanthus sonchifolius TaxID=185202 RepID=A0ACB9IBN8_9ASTR|nr:hypothetical protein L1987_26811 [Smallanthus sonchifolius]
MLILRIKSFYQILKSKVADNLKSGQIIPVAANDVAFSSHTHAVLLTAFSLFQITIYDADIKYPNYCYQMKTVSSSSGW